jgi:hypothetical protein
MDCDPAAGIAVRPTPSPNERDQTMRRILGAVLIGLAFLLSLDAVATAQDEHYMELLRSDLRADQTAIMTEAMDLTSDQATLFWPIYREYQHEVERIGDQQIALLQDYAAHYLTMTDDKATDLVKQSFTLEKKRLDLRRKYNGKIEKALGGVIAARFVQVDRELAMLIFLQASAAIPLVEPTGSDAPGGP